eukprot:CAMPEP_0202908006 /NCGR_PEP_ID=MMETSP1392-20130828/44507_1 /ASSEMBLY_ACC=CAM_ASM_000868 /TAXON_ID=225041 /ORGANISM="Chlamydomonas chlamydogama, Strain SAG 11-48b" /LENGTH=956 /DNA_ID=CAMNT_0049597119 /DNA_START=64 /DNA_END=2934 /DNA_ORIENTATION=-
MKSRKLRLWPSVGACAFTSSKCIIFLFLGLASTVDSATQSCISYQPKGILKLNKDAGDLVTNATMAGPGRMECHTWLLQSNSSQTCSAPTSVLLLEWWGLKAGGAPVDSLTALRGSFVLAAQGSAPQVMVIDDKPRYLPSAAPSLLAPCGSGNCTYLDSIAVDDARSYQRVMLPLGNSPNSTWLVTIANLNSDSGLDGYMLRATCFESAQDVPCPRPIPSLGQCGNPLGGPDGPGNGSRGSCVAVQGSPVRRCQCQPGYADLGCNAPVTPITAFGTVLAVHVPVSSWRFFEVTIPGFRPNDARAKLLVEVSQPPGLGPQYQMALVLTPKAYWPASAGPVLGSSGSSGSSMMDVPQLSDIDLAEQLNRIPLQSLGYAYLLMDSTRLGSAASWYLGLYNAAPRSRGAGSSGQQGEGNTGPLQLKVQYANTDSNGTAPSALCPRDCSGAGTCLDPGASPTAGYWCQCNQGFGGPMCEGPQMEGWLGSGPGAKFTDSVISPGSWQFYQVHIDPRALVYSQDSLQIDWVPSRTSATPNLYLAVTPMFTRSYGENFYSPSNLQVLSRAGTAKYYGLYTPYGLVTNWIVMVYNDDSTTSTTTSTYTLTISLPSNATSRFTTWQLGLILALASAILCLGMLFWAVRVIMARRLQQREYNQLMGRGRSRRGAAGSMLDVVVPWPPNGRTSSSVPTEVVASFPAFPYDPASCASSGSRAFRPAATSPHKAAAAAAAAALPGGFEGTGQQQLAAAATGDAAAAIVVTPGVAGAVGDAEGDDGLADFEVVCAVCLGDYEAGEMVRKLPCKHLFHQSCIDQWMEGQATCPICRTSLLPPEPVSSEPPLSPAEEVEQSGSRRFQRRLRTSSSRRLRSLLSSPSPSSPAQEGAAPAAALTQSAPPPPGAPRRPAGSATQLPAASPSATSLPPCDEPEGGGSRDVSNPRAGGAARQAAELQLVETGGQRAPR